MLNKISRDEEPTSTSHFPGSVTHLSTFVLSYSNAQSSNTISTSVNLQILIFTKIMHIIRLQRTKTITIWLYALF